MDHQGSTLYIELEDAGAASWWAGPEMTRSLAELRREIEADGWVVTGHGYQPWDLRYQRRDTARSGD